MFIFDKHLSEKQALYAVIGDPIAHSMSPDIHNASFKKLGIEANYHAIRIRKDDLEAEIRSLVHNGYKGFNVTIPHKVAMIGIVDEIDPIAEKIGAINTVVVRNGRMIGYNTDGFGFLRAINYWYQPVLNEAEVLIIGAGGAARAISVALSENGVTRMTLANRTIEKAEALISKCNLDGQAVSLEQAESNLAHYDLIINTTPIGMEPMTDQSPIRMERARSGTYVCDIIYNPLQTKWLKEAKDKGCYIQNGIPMFVQQAALSFEYWTGSIPDTQLMENIVHRRLTQPRMDD